MPSCPTLPFALAAVAGLTVPLAAQSITFRPRVDFGLAQENPQQAVVADFDHDGNLDVAITLEGYNQGKVQVLFGDGASDFSRSFEASSYVAWGLGLGDFDGDGWMDLAATSYGWAQHGVRVWRNNQAGGLVNNTTVSTLGTPPVAVCSGDLDGDGLLDLAAISEGGGYAVDWFHGNGNGSFSAFRVVPNTLGLTGRRIYTGHFNADPYLDLLAIHQSGAMVLLNDNLGHGNLNAAAGIPLTEAMSAAAVADLDGDGKDDVVTAGANLRVWHGVGNGSFTLLNSYPTTTGSLDVQLGDLDHDGRRDALVVGLGGAQLFLGLGGGAFRSPLNLPTGVYPKAGVLGDWNGDGWPDLAILCQNYAGMDPYLSVYEQVPPAVTAAAVAFGTGCGTPALGFVPAASARPLLGHSGGATVVNAPTLVAAVALGASDQFLGAVPLPLALDGLGMTGCSLLQSTELVPLPLTPLSQNSLALSVPVPATLSLLGARVYLQAFAYAPGQNPAAMVLSNGIAWTLGNN